MVTGYIIVIFLLKLCISHTVSCISELGNSTFVLGRFCGAPIYVGETKVKRVEIPTTSSLAISGLHTCSHV